MLSYCPTNGLTITNPEFEIRAGLAHCAENGGGGGIRTPEALSSLTVFKTAGFNRSPTPPFLILTYSAGFTGSHHVSSVWQSPCQLLLLGTARVRTADPLLAAVFACAANALIGAIVFGFEEPSRLIPSAVRSLPWEVCLWTMHSNGPCPGGSRGDEEDGDDLGRHETLCTNCAPN